MEETQTFEQLTAKEKTLIQTPKTVGGYDITGGSTGYIIFNMTKKPNVVHRFFCRLLLGWKWTDEDVIRIVEKSRETGLTAEYLILLKQPITEWEVEFINGKLTLKQ